MDSQWRRLPTWPMSIALDTSLLVKVTQMSKVCKYSGMSHHSLGRRSNKPKALWIFNDKNRASLSTAVGLSWSYLSKTIIFRVITHILVAQNLPFSRFWGPMIRPSPVSDMRRTSLASHPAIPLPIHRLPPEQVIIQRIDAPCHH